MKSSLVGQEDRTGLALYAPACWPRGRPLSADGRRERNAAARAVDPTLGGFATLEARGPDGLVPDAAARRAFFGE